MEAFIGPYPTFLGLLSDTAFCDRAWVSEASQPATTGTPVFRQGNSVQPGVLRKLEEVGREGDWMPLQSRYGIT